MSVKKPRVEPSRSPGTGGETGSEMFGQFQDWCLRTYGDSGKTKTVTRRKYNKILQTLLSGEEAEGGGVFTESSQINAKFKFWVKSKGFQVGSLTGERLSNGSLDRPVLYVPVKTAVTDAAASQDSALKRVAVVEDFFHIIYSMHVEMGVDPGRAPKHAGQKKTYKAIAETYAFLPREAVTRFLMSCAECQKRMHINPPGAEFKENDRPSSLAPEVIDFNMPLTTTYLKQMRLQRMSINQQDESSVSSEDFDMSDPTWISAERPPASDLSPPDRAARMHSPQNAHKEEDDDSSSESGSGHGLSGLTPPSAGGAAPSDLAGVAAAALGGGGGGARSPYGEVVNGNGPRPAPLDFSTATSSPSSSSEEQQPMNLSERLGPPGPPAAAALLQPDPPDQLRRKYGVPPGKAGAPPTPLPLGPTPLPLPLGLPHPHHPAELRMDRDIRDIRDYGSKSPQYSYDSGKMEVGAEDLTVGRAQAVADDDDDEHDDHDDSDKINDAEGVDTERLKAFNMFVRLFVDENLDRMVPISKQPKEKIQAIIESCSRQFPEFQERARKRIRTYLKSCRRMKKNGMETRPTPPHLTSAMAENILAAACESESRKAAKRMRLDVYQTHEDQISLDKPVCREPASLAHSAYSLAASAFSQDPGLYINGGLNYSYRGYGGLGASMQHPVSLTTGTAQSNGPTDLSMKSLGSNSSSSSSSTSLGGRGGGGVGGGAGAAAAGAQLSPTEVTAVRQLIAGYRESAAFLLRSADELESLILQQN